jgi:hypothetical protein
MRLTLVSVLLFTGMCHGADDPPKASRKLEGRTTPFPAKTIAEGVKVTISVLESCHSLDDGTRNGGNLAYSTANLKKAQEGDHLRFEFPKPVKVKILDKTYEVSEVVFADGAFWLRCGDKVVRSTKYEFAKSKAFVEWFRQAL